MKNHRRIEEDFPGSARASRAFFGVLAEEPYADSAMHHLFRTMPILRGATSTKVSARAPKPAREGACAPQPYD